MKKKTTKKFSEDQVNEILAVSSLEGSIKTNGEELDSRFKTLLWSAGSMLAVMSLDFLAQNVGLFNMPDFLVVVVGLIVPQITKYLRNTQYYQWAIKELENE